MAQLISLLQKVRVSLPYVSKRISETLCSSVNVAVIDMAWTSTISVSYRLFIRSGQMYRSLIFGRM